MERHPPVSIIVPTYNRASTLRQTLSSIVGQTFRDFEVIVVDDGSTDDTRTVVENILQGVSNKYIYQPNGGVAKARETGMRASQGDYLAFCDSDDLWLPEKMAMQMKLFTEDTALVFSDGYICSELFPEPKIRFRYYELGTPYRGEVYAKLLLKNFIMTSSVVVRSNFMDGFLAFPPTACDDWQMWLWVARQKGLFDYVEQPLVHYYEHSQGISKQKMEFAKDRLIIRSKEFDFIKSKKLLYTKARGSVRLLILKDILLRCILRILPKWTVSSLCALYYKSPTLRKLVLKTRLGN